MKRLLGIAMGLTLLSSLALTVPPKALAVELRNDSTLLAPLEKHGQEAQVVYSILTRYHYRKTPVNDSLSSVLFDTYLQALDPNKVYFLQSDIDQFAEQRYKLDEALAEGDLSFAYDVFNLYLERVSDRLQWVLNRLEGEPFDYSIDESYDANRKDALWATTQGQLDELWRKVVKNQALGYVLADEDKSWEDISSALIKRYDRQLRSNAQFKSEDVFQAFMNTFAESFDPHTNYFSPISSENFQINMSQSLEGIGARLSSDLDYVRVADIIPGGPAYKSKLLFKDDRIIGVAQGVEGEFVDVIGWRLDDVVQLIRGPKGTIVRLRILKAADGPAAMPSEITLVRDKVKLEDEVAKSQVVPITLDGKAYRVGIITIPSFYMEFEAASRGEKDYNSTTRDVRRLITEMETDGGIDGLLIDLRYNGGGSLQEAVELSGLFIPDGPVVQVKDNQGRISVEKDPDPQLFYSGPMGVMVNRFSASASEIFAGAIQDYERGVIMGDVTYGKGTVQNMIGLNNVAQRIEAKLGNLKLTLAKFYRVTGSSTQTSGVSPDVQLPSEFDRDEYGEASQPNELPWDQIPATYFKPMHSVDNSLISALNDFHQGRMDTDADLKALLDDYQASREARNRTEVSLNETVRREEMEARQRRIANQENLMDDTISPDGEVNAEEQETLDDTLLWEGVMLMAKLLTLQKV